MVKNLLDYTMRGSSTTPLYRAAEGLNLFGLGDRTSEGSEVSVDCGYKNQTRLWLVGLQASPSPPRIMPPPPRQTVDPLGVLV